MMKSITNVVPRRTLARHWFKGGKITHVGKRAPEGQRFSGLPKRTARKNVLDPLLVR